MVTSVKFNEITGFLALAKSMYQYFKNYLRNELQTQDTVNMYIALVLENVNEEMGK